MREEVHGDRRHPRSRSLWGFRTLTVRHRAGTAPDRNFPPPREPPLSPLTDDRVPHHPLRDEELPVNFRTM